MGNTLFCYLVNWIVVNTCILVTMPKTLLRCFGLTLYIFHMYKQNDQLNPKF